MKMLLAGLFIWFIAFQLTNGHQIIGFNSLISEDYIELESNTRNVFNKWDIRSENGYYNYDIYDPVNNIFVIPIEGIYFLSANLIIETSIKTDISLYFQNNFTSEIYCDSFKKFLSDTKDTLSISCFIRLNEMIKLNLILRNNENIKISLGSSIGLQYVGLPGYIASFVLPLATKDGMFITHAGNNTELFKYYNSLSVIEDLSNISITCTGLHLLSVNAIITPGNSGYFRITTDNDINIMDLTFPNGGDKRSITFLKAIKLSKGQFVQIFINNVELFDNSLYTILKLDQIHEESDYFSLPINANKIKADNYTFGQLRLRIPIEQIKEPYFRNKVQLNERGALQLQHGGLYFLSINYMFSSTEEIDINIVLNTEDGLDMSEVDEASGYNMAFKSKITKNQYNIQINGLLELKKNSIISLIIISKNEKKLEILDSSRILLIPVPIITFKGQIKITEIEKNVLVCTKEGNIINGFRKTTYNDDGNVNRQTFLNKFISKEKNSYIVPTAGIYFFSISMMISSPESHNGNISVNIMYNKKVLMKHKIKYSLYTNHKQIIKHAQILDLKKDFKIQIEVMCINKLQIHDGIDFTIILLKSAAKSFQMSLPIENNIQTYKLDTEVVTGQFKIPQSGVYMVTIDQKIIFESLENQISYITIYVYQRSKQTGIAIRKYLSPSANDQEGTITVQLIDIFKLEKNVDVIVSLILTKREPLLEVYATKCKNSFYKVSSFYGFKAKQNSPKLLTLIDNQVSIGNLKFLENDGGFKYPTTQFFGRTNFIVSKTMTMFYVVLIEALNVRAGSLKLYFLLRPSGRHIEITPFVKGKSWTFLEAYGTLNLERGEILQLALESSAAEKVLISRSSWAMMELTDPSIPMSWLDDKNKQMKVDVLIEDTYFTSNDVNQFTINNSSTRSQNSHSTYKIGKEIITANQWNTNNYMEEVIDDICNNVLILVKSTNKSKDFDLQLKITSPTETFVLPFLPKSYSKSLLLLCLNSTHRISLTNPAGNSTPDESWLSLVRLPKHNSAEGFSSIILQDNTIYVTNVFTRADGWTTYSELSFKQTQRFRDGKGAYHVNENGYYLINIILKLDVLSKDNSCIFTILNDENRIVTFNIGAKESLLYNNVIWLQRFNTIQLGFICDSMNSNINIQEKSVFGMFLLDSQPSFSSDCTTSESELETNVNKSTIFIQSNKNFTFDCSSNINDITDYYWYRNNEVVKEIIGSRNGIFTMLNVTELNNGVYECVSQTGMVDKRSKKINLMVIDPTPVLRLSNNTVFVEENYVANKLLAWIRTEAKNPETNRNARVSLKIIRGDEENNFYFTPPISDTFSAISYITPFNFETQQVYNLVIQAENIDFESDSKAVSLIQLNVIVVNRNDHQPVFSKDVLNFTLKENTKIGYKVFTVSTTDLDTNDENKLSYSLLSTKSSSLFKISPDTGDLFVNGRIDYESDKTISLICSVNDGTFTSFKHIKINVLDVNDNRPKFTQSSFKVNITIDEKVNEKIIKLTAIDLDSGTYGKVTFAILDGNDKDFFRIEDGYIVLNKALSAIERFQLYVTAVDGGNLYCFNPAYVYINVGESNVLPVPLFEQQFYEVTLKEGLKVPVAILHVKMQTIMKNVVFKVKELPYEKQQVSILQNGTIVLQKPIDYEESAYLHLVLNACVVKKKKERCGTAYVTVNILDINDNRPLFSKSFYTVYIRSTLAEQSLVTAVTAQDKDLNENGKIRYFLHTNNDYFQIDRLDGSIILIKSLNVTKSYKLYIEARDNGSPSLSSHCYVNVNVEKDAFVLTLPPATLKKEEDVPLISNWMFWVVALAVLLLVVVPFIVLAACLRYKRMKNEMAERLKLREEHNSNEVTGLISYLSKPAESVECILSYSCETLPSAYSSRKNLHSSKASLNGIIVHSSDGWDSNSLLNGVLEEEDIRNDSIDVDSHKGLLNGDVLQINQQNGHIT